MPVLAEELIDLQELRLERLSLEESWDELQAGGTIVIEKYESTQGKDILVRLNKRQHTVTQISFDVAPIVGGFDKRFWQIFNVSINALSLKNVYRYDEALYNLKNQFNVDAIVEYASTAGGKDVAVVTAVFMDAAGDFYYALSRETQLYKETELTSAI